LRNKKFEYQSKTLSGAALRAVGTDAWEKCYIQSDAASFFQSPKWSLLWSRFTGGSYEPAPLAVDLPGGETLVFPLSRQRIAGKNRIHMACFTGRYIWRTIDTGSL
jgi:hypothetical protein